MQLKVPYPIPEPERSALISAGLIAMAEFENGQGGGWQRAHTRVEEIIADIMARYGVVQ